MIFVLWFEKVSSTLIDDYAFYNVPAIQSIQMDTSGVIDLGEGVFALSSAPTGGLKNIALPNGITGEKNKSELGDLLFILSGYARHIGLEPETALNAANNRFIKRFGYVEKKVQVSKKTWQDFSLAELDAFWELAKDFEKNN